MFGHLGANPIATALNQLGLLTLLFLIACLSCTPLKTVFGLKWPMKLRKTLGLFAFLSGSLHFFVYVAIDQAFMLQSVLDDVIKRPFIAVGAATLLTLTPLALTSTKRALQALGPHRWKRLHKLIYLSIVLALIHFFMRVKIDIREPTIYAAVVAVLLGIRLVDAARKRFAGRLSAQK